MTTSPAKSSVPHIHPVFAFCTALTCGVLGALMTQVVLSQQWDIQIAGMWQLFSGSSGMSGRQALSWWAIPGVALLVGIAVGGLMSGTVLLGRGTRLLRWALGALIVYGLAEFGHSAQVPHDVPAGIQLASTLVALCVAAIMAMFGAFFVVRR